MAVQIEFSGLKGVQIVGKLVATAVSGPQHCHSADVPGHGDQRPCARVLVPAEQTTFGVLLNATLN
jgi:hypothetical protein